MGCRCIPALSIGFLSIVFGCAGPAPGVAAASAFGDSRRGSPGELPCFLEIAVPRPSLLLGEPAVLVVSLENRGEKDIMLRDLLSPEYEILEVWILRPGDEREVRYSTPVQRDARGKPPRPLPPQGRLTAWLPIYIGSDGWLLDRPGTYRVRAEYAIEGNGRAASKPVSFDVKPPERESDRRAAKLLMESDAAWFLFLGGDDAAPDGRAHIEKLIYEYPESPAAPYARLALGISLSYDRFDPETKSFRGSDPVKAAKELARAAREIKDPILAGTGAAALSRSLRSLGRETEAAKALEDYFEAHPDARTLPGVAKKIEEAARARP